MGIFSTMINAAVQNQLADKQHKYNKELLGMQNDYALQQQEHTMQLQNARSDYLIENQPALTVQALKNAGLNPALAGGAQTVAAVGSPSSNTPSASAGLAHADSGGDFASLRDFKELSLLKHQEELLDAQTLDKYADVASKNAFRDPTVQGLVTSAFQAKTQGFLNQALESRNDTLTPAQVSEAFAHAKFMSTSARATAEKLSPEIRLLCAQALQATEGAANHQAQAGYYSESARTEASKRHLNYANADYYVHTAAKLDKDIEYLGTLMGTTRQQGKMYAAEARKAAAEGRIGEWKAQYQEAIGPEASRYIDEVEKGVNTLSDAISNIKPGVKVQNHTNVKGNYNYIKKNQNYKVTAED